MGLWSISSSTSIHKACFLALLTHLTIDCLVCFMSLESGSQDQDNSRSITIIHIPPNCYRQRPRVLAHTCRWLAPAPGSAGRLRWQRSTCSLWGTLCRASVAGPRIPSVPQRQARRTCSRAETDNRLTIPRENWGNLVLLIISLNLFSTIISTLFADWFFNSLKLSSCVRTCLNSRIWN